MKNSLFFSQRARLVLVPLCLILLACGLWPEMELLVPSLPALKEFLKVSEGEIQQLLTANFVGFLLGVLFAGPMCDSFGRRTVLVYGMLCYLLSSLFSVAASDFYLLMVARFLQGFTMTGPVIAGGVILFELTAGARQVFWMTLANSIVTFCMAAAPIVGSWIQIRFGFRGSLWSIFILGCVAAFPAFALAPESLSQEKRRPLSFKTVLEAYLMLLQDKRFMNLALPVCALAAAYWIYVGVSALFMVDYLGIDASAFGSYQGPIVGCFSVISLASSWLLKKFGLMRCIKAGLTSMFIGCLSLFTMSVWGLDSAEATTLFMMLFVGGMAPVCSLLFPYSMNHLPPHLQGSAQALIQALRLLFSSIGTFILGFVYVGPLLPVAGILLTILMLSSALLWLGRCFFRSSDEKVSAWVGH